MQALSPTQPSVPTQWQKIKKAIQAKVKQWPTQPLTFIITMNLIWIEHKVSQLDQPQSSLTQMTHQLYIFQETLPSINNAEKLNNSLEALLTSIN